MFARIRRFSRVFLNNSRTINNEPLNKVSIIVVILIDLFILFNVFTGLNDISQWHLSPYQSYPCYSEWNDYRNDKSSGKDYQILRSALQSPSAGASSFQNSYQQVEDNHLGQVSPTCLEYAALKDKINQPDNQKIAQTIDQKEISISNLQTKNQTIRQQYDSTLLEKIANQPPEQSINAVGAEKAKQELDKNNRGIATLEKDIITLKAQFLNKPESAAFIQLLQDSGTFTKLETDHDRLAFWYPSIQLGLQAVFLVPLILVALSVHNLAQRRGYGLVSLISWHLLVIFVIPLILKVFEFFQIGIIFQFLVDFIKAFLGNLLFLISYVYILIVPLAGFGIIKFFQNIVFNTKSQAASRVQKSRCIRCAKKMRPQDSHCPHCGFYQYSECPNCHTPTYKYLPYCRECGHSQN